MGTYREAASGRRFAPEWQIVLLNELLGTESIRAVFARFYSISAIFRIFSSLGRQAHRGGDVVYASLFHRRVCREAHQTRRIAYTTIG
jgi:hypothetical protein